jgi:hypothetical protein
MHLAFKGYPMASPQITGQAAVCDMAGIDITQRLPAALMAFCLEWLDLVFKGWLRSRRIAQLCCPRKIIYVG